MKYFPNLGVLLLVTVMVYLSKSNFFAAGQSSSLYTKQEIDAIKKFRPKVEHLLTLDYQNKDGYLLSFIRRNKFDLRKAFESLEKIHQWREKNNIDSLDLESLKNNNKFLPCKVKGHDRGGRPILLLPFGKWKIRNYVIAGKQEEALRHFRICHETSIRAVFDKAEATGQDIDQYYFIVDVDGFNLRDSLCLGCVPLTLSMVASFNAMSSDVLLKNVTVVNAPRIAQPVIVLAKNILPESLHIVNDYDSDKKKWQPLLYKDIAPDQLPKSLGGTQQS